MLQTTSVLRNPVFVDGENYNGTPNPKRNPLLREQLLSGFVRDANAIPQARIVALGAKVAEIIDLLVTQGALDASRVLGTVPHPSRENAERVNYFLGKKPRAALSSKVDPDKLDRARETIMGRIAALS
jgi:hypothetical protein